MDWLQNLDVLVTYMEEHFSTPIIRLDEEGLIIECNAALPRILGQREKPIGVNMKDFLTKETVLGFRLPTINEKHLKTLWHFVTPTITYRFDCHVLRTDKGITVFTERPLITGDTIVAQMGALNLEMTNMSRELLQKNIVMEEKNKSLEGELFQKIIQAERLAALAALSAGIAHEITQPLNSLKLAADSAVYYHKQGKSLPMNDVLADMESISNQAKNIDGIIRHIRALVNKEPIHMAVCDLNMAIRDALPEIQKRAESKGIMLTAILSSKKLAVLGNLVGLKEIVTNLINNSVIALQRGEISEKKIILKTNWKKNQIILEIADNGFGIPEEYQEKIFEPFFTAAGERGMGLGLSIVKAIVSAHQGTIRVKSLAGKGTAFFVELPVYCAN